MAIADNPCVANGTCTVLSIDSKHADLAQPVAFGLPFKQGSQRRLPDTATMLHDSGASAEVQLRKLASWPDGSVMAARCDAIVPGLSAPGRWRIELRHSNTRAPQETVRQHETGFRVRCGVETLWIAVDAPDNQPCTWRLGAESWRLLDRSGKTHAPVLDSPQLVAAGPVAAMLAQRGEFKEFPGLSIHLLWMVYPRAGLVRCDATLLNARRARHPGGIWDLGDPGSHLFRDFSFLLHAPAAEPRELLLSIKPEADQDEHPSHVGVHLFQGSSGGRNWKSDSHLNRLRQNPCRIAGYEGKANRETFRGARSSPTIRLSNGQQSAALACVDFWQNFPKAASATPEGIRLGIFPEEWGDLHELQGGERKRHTFWLALQNSADPPADLSWVYSPAVTTAPASRWVATELVGEMRPQAGSTFDQFKTVARDSFFDDQGVIANRERFDEYGWRNFGDTHADHESVYYTGERPFVSHYNNQFDVLLGYLLQHLRTGERIWFEHADALARHVMDIDIYHTLEDKSAYNGGLFWFTDHYQTAHTSTHRTYSQHNAPSTGDYGGGPGAEHNYAEGLRLYHLLTGCPFARDAVLGLADWVVRMEDGIQTIFGLVDDGPTGLATLEKAYPSRGGANSISVLLDAWSLSRCDQYLDLAETLIQRCIHPEDDVDSLDLLDAENNWSYTMFLTSLSKYLGHKEHAEQRDEGYHYARESLLHYAQWMADNERAYLDYPDKLEYPTEAWAAQEFRKANVFRRAARYAGSELNARLLEKGNEFGDRAWSDLMRFEETRMTIRSFALVMTEGLTDCVYRHKPPKSAGIAFERFDYPKKVVFLSQKQRMMNAVRSPRGVCKLLLHAAEPKRWRAWRRARKRSWAVENAV